MDGHGGVLTWGVLLVGVPLPAQTGPTLIMANNMILKQNLSCRRIKI
jgi:hypothetical protein